MEDAVDLLEIVKEVERQEKIKMLEEKEKIKKEKKKRKIKYMIFVVCVLIGIILMILISAFALVKAHDQSDYVKQKINSTNVVYEVKDTRCENGTGPKAFLKSGNFCTYYKNNIYPADVTVYTNAKGVIYDNTKKLGYLKILSNEISEIIPIDNELYKLDFSNTTYENDLQKISTQLTEFTGTKYEDYEDYLNNAEISIAINIIGRTSLETAKEITSDIQKESQKLGISHGFIEVCFRETEDDETYYTCNFETKNVGGYKF